MCSSLFCSTSICANANRAGVSEHHHNHQKAGEGEPMLGGVASYSHVKCLLHVTVCCCHADLRQR